MAILSAAALAATLFTGCTQTKKSTLPVEPINAFDAAVRTFDTDHSQSAYNNCISELKTLLANEVTFDDTATEILPTNDAAYVKTGDVITLGDISLRVIQFGVLQGEAEEGDMVFVQYKRGEEATAYVDQLFTANNSGTDIKENVASVTASATDTLIYVKIITSVYNTASENSVLKNYQFQFDGWNWMPL